MTTKDWRSEDFLKVPEYAEITRMSVESVYAAIRRGDIPTVRTGPRSIRIPTAALRRLAGTEA